jgi:hypothetical protein
MLRFGDGKMFKRSMAKVGAASVALGTLLAVGVAAPVSAAPVRIPVDVVVHTDFSADVSAFEGNIPGCETGTVVEGASKTHFTPWGGVFVGVKEFTCAGGEGGFDVRLNARFSDLGSIGSWRVIDGWGNYDGVRASGFLTGTITDIGIDDRYTGIAR